MMHGLLVVLSASFLASASPNAYEIFDAARAQWQAETYPEYLEYTIETDVATKIGTIVNDYKALCYCSKGDIRVDPVSLEEAQHPTTPHGINLHINFTIGMGGGGSETITKGINATPNPDPLGVPLLSPLYSFGLRQEPLQTAHAQTDSSNLPTIIVTTSSAKRHYDVEFAGVEELDGGQTYHLALSAVSDPETYRLRDLWVDTKTFETRRAVVAENFTGTLRSMTPWTIDFAQEDGFQYIVDESSGASKILFKGVTPTQPGVPELLIDDSIPNALREPR